uniref:Sulfite reductase [NADPH] flavoprotein alpha-component n=1 Tax=Thiocapsa roseopersicina TaxID=1058 RepID=CYSJ_THIRO|nr:RecName: Full=Sulfite reductase [NADPH] flavoprotein alpha-component; Short=SIR-FP [Thiocapsa roseopersicina]CAA80687.1 sulfite reductase (NADPH) [Thiocapsa roseopersicina]
MVLSQLNGLTSPLDERHVHALQIALKGMTPTQLAWVSGYLAGIGGGPLRMPTEPKAVERITILFGSQTGNAKAVAEQLGARASEQGMDARVISMGDFNPRKLSKEQWVLIVVSTHGEGEPPENAYALHAFIQDQGAGRLEQLPFAVLGLGDSSYEHFCRTAVDFDRRLAELGAQRILPLQCCALDYRSDTERWSSDALNRLSALAPRKASNVVAMPTLRSHQDLRSHQEQSRNRARPYDKDNPYTATLLENRRITTLDAVSDVRHLALAIEPDAMHYRPGDALGVWVENDPSLADTILAGVGIDGAARIELGDEELDLRHALIERLELTQLHPTTVRGWSRASGRTGAEDAGERLEREEQTRIYLAGNDAFRLPDAGDTPLIMIGAGTGVAPYRAFLQQRAANGHPGRNWLIFGNRHFHRDFLYQLDWQAHRKAGRLDRVSLAFSRDGAEKPYVQQRLREEGKEILRWLDAGAHLYVCGATAMGQAVDHALVEIFTIEAGLDPDCASLRRYPARECYATDDL